MWPRDFAGNDRFVNGSLDIGAYAFGNSLPAPPDPAPPTIPTPDLLGHLPHHPVHSNYLNSDNIRQT